MGLPYEEKLREMIEQEDDSLRKAMPDTVPVYTVRVVFKGKEYMITGGSFIRSIEPFDQELCDLIFQIRKKAEYAERVVIGGGFSLLIDWAMFELNRGVPASEVLFHYPFNDDDDEQPAAEG